LIIMGQSTERRLLVVAYTERRRAIRLISAREATKKERRALAAAFPDSGAVNEALRFLLRITQKGLASRS